MQLSDWFRLPRSWSSPSLPSASDFPMDVWDRVVLDRPSSLYKTAMNCQYEYIEKIWKSYPKPHHCTQSRGSISVKPSNMWRCWAHPHRPPRGCRLCWPSHDVCRMSINRLETPAGLNWRTLLVLWEIGCRNGRWWSQKKVSLIRSVHPPSFCSDPESLSEIQTIESVATNSHHRQHQVQHIITLTEPDSSLYTSHKDSLPGLDTPSPSTDTCSTAEALGYISMSASITKPLRIVA